MSNRCGRVTRPLNAAPRAWWRHAAILLAVAAPLAPCWSAGGAYSASGHGNTFTGVNRLPALYSPGECGHCHQGHAAQGTDTNLYPYALFGREENACWPCHDGTVPYAANAKLPISTAPANTSTDFYKHPVSDLYSGITPSAHRWGENTAAAFSGANRHCECTDCHDPHTAKNNGAVGASVHTVTGSTNGNRLSNALFGATGLIVGGWQAAGLPFSGAAYTFGNLRSVSTNYEYQICLKCHSSFVTLPTFSAIGSGNFVAVKITSTNASQVKEYQDIGQAINPNNLSYHPIAAVGRNTTVAAGSFVGPWTASSTMYCSDCHTNAQGSAGASGAHGSTNIHMLSNPCYLQEQRHYTTPTGGTIGVDPTELCFRCHRWQTYAQSGTGADPATNTGFRNGDGNLHTRHINSLAQGCTCYSCHDVHGTNKEHLINFNRAVVSGAANSQAAFTNISGASSGGTCNLTCHGEGHNETYTHTP